MWDLVEYVYTNKIDIDDDIKNVIAKTNILTNPNEIKINPNFVEFNEISASALETYFKCPLSYFFNYILKLKEPISNEIEMMDIGNILHELAYLYYSNPNKDSLNIKEFCNNTIYSIISKDERLQPHLSSPILINLLAEAERFIEHLRDLDNHSKFTPTYFEKSFGPKSKFPALPLTDKVSLKGKVDRIDIFKNYFRIIDYKSGSADATFEELYYGKKLQLFLYALAIQNATGKDLSGTFYLPIQNVVEKADNDENIYKLMGFYTDNADLAKIYDTNLETELKSNYVNMTLKKDGTFSKRSDKVLSSSEMQRLMDYAKELSVKALNEISTGNFKASPLKFDKKKDACQYCPYLSLCSKASNNVEFRNMGNVTLSSFVAHNQSNNLKGGQDE